METASCRTLPAALVTKEISPNSRFVPLFSMIAIPIVIIKSTGSNHEFVVRSSTINVTGRTNSMIFWISDEVWNGDNASVTAVPDIELSSPIMSRISSTAAFFSVSSSTTVMEYRASESLYHSSIVSWFAFSSGS